VDEVLALVLRAPEATDESERDVPQSSGEAHP